MDTQRTVRLGSSDVRFPSNELQPAVDTSSLLKNGDYAGLKAVFDRDGFLVLKGVIPKDAVLNARQFVLDDFAKHDDVLQSGSAASEGVLNPRCNIGCVPFMEGRNAITHSDALLRVLEAPELRSLMEHLLGVPDVLTFDYKWLRGVPRDGYTGAHVDSVYMSRGSPRLHTTWIPLDYCSLELGALAMCAGSHRLPGFSHFQETYGRLDVERDGLVGTGWFSNDPREIAALDPQAQWHSCDYEPGDVVVFGMHTVHMSTANLTDRVRLSADARWQPASDPVDRRYVGSAEEVDPRHRVKTGAYTPDNQSGDNNANTAAPKVTLADLRARWGLPVPVPQG